MGRRAEIIDDADFTPLHDKRGAIIGAIRILRDTTLSRAIRGLIARTG